MKLGATIVIVLFATPAVGAVDCEITPRILVAEDGGPSQGFGKHIALQGSLLAVTAGGTFPPPHAYVFRVDGDAHQELAKIAPTDPDQNFNNGDIAISRDGTLIAIGALADQEDVDGEVYIFSVDPEDNVDFVTKLSPTQGLFEPLFGYALEFGDDSLLVGSPPPFSPDDPTGYLHLYETSTWTVTDIIGNDNTDGFSVALSRNANFIIADGDGSHPGAQGWFELGDEWFSRQFLQPGNVGSTLFGTSLAVQDGEVWVGGGSGQFCSSQMVVYKQPILGPDVPVVLREVFTESFCPSVSSQFGNNFDLSDGGSTAFATKSEVLYMTHGGRDFICQQNFFEPGGPFPSLREIRGVEGTTFIGHPNDPFLGETGRGSVWILRSPILLTDGFGRGDTSRWSSCTGCV